MFSAFVRSCPTHNPVFFLSECSSTKSAWCSVRFRSPRPIIFFTLHLFANITLTISQNHSFGPLCHSVLPNPRKIANISPCQPLKDHLFATFDFESTPRDCFAVPCACRSRHSTHFWPRPHRLNVRFRDNHARSVSLNALRFMSTPPTALESPPRTVSSRTPPPVNAENVSLSENKYAAAQFTFQSFDRFLLALLCICVTCFFFLNLRSALYFYFQ